jgi:hypothetical protein
VAKTLTSFIIALSDSRKMRDKYRDNNKRGNLLDEWDLTHHAALQPGATVEDVRQAVVEEGGVAQVEWWILANQAPVANEDYDPSA